MYSMYTALYLYMHCRSVKGVQYVCIMYWTVQLTALLESHYSILQCMNYEYEDNTNTLWPMEQLVWEDTSINTHLLCIQSFTVYTDKQTDNISHLVKHHITKWVASWLQSSGSLMDIGASPATILTIANNSRSWNGGVAVNISTTVQPTLLKGIYDVMGRGEYLTMILTVLLEYFD